MKVREELSSEESAGVRSVQPALGIQLKTRAENLGLKGAEVARRAGLSPKRYNNYVSGLRVPGLKSLQRISNVLKTSVDELLDPDWALMHRDEATHRAMSQLKDALGDLHNKDIQFIADLATFVGSNRENDRRASIGRAISPAIQLLARVHEDLIPAIIRRFVPEQLYTETLAPEDGRLAIQISMDFNSDAPAGLRTAALQNLAQERLGLPAKRIRVRENLAGKQASVSIELGVSTVR